MSETCARLHLLMGDDLTRGLSLAMPSIQPGDCLILAQSHRRGDELTECLQQLQPSVRIKQLGSGSSDVGKSITDADLAEALCRAEKIFSWW